ncbi:MAG: molybdenum cofactor biosynthesis protein B [Candidatus Methanomethylicia archaeon]
MSMEHKEEALKEVLEVKVSIIVVSTSRYEKKIHGEEFKDESGEEAVKIAEKYGFKVLCKEVIPDNEKMIREELFNKVEMGSDMIIFIGGTGLSQTDVTCEVLQNILDKRIDGFGEIFRMLSYREIGAAAIMSRAIAGLFKGVLVAAIPGSQKAVTLALEKLLFPEVKHILYHARKK